MNPPLRQAHGAWRGRLAALRERLRKQLEEALAGARAVAFLNDPNIPNIGDSLLWLGARGLLQSLGLKLA